MSGDTMPMSFELKGNSLNWCWTCTGFKRHEKYWMTFFFSSSHPNATLFLYPTHDKSLINMHTCTKQAKLHVILNLPLLRRLQIKVHSNSLYKYPIGEVMNVATPSFKEHCNKTLEWVFFQRVGFYGAFPPYLNVYLHIETYADESYPLE